MDMLGKVRRMRMRDKISISEFASTSAIAAAIASRMPPADSSATNLRSAWIPRMCRYVPFSGLQARTSGGVALDKQLISRSLGDGDDTGVR